MDKKPDSLGGNITRGLGTIIGNAGEYLVVGELLKRGVIAAPAPRNAPGFDVLATSGPKSVNLRVKTKSQEADSWVWMCGKDPERTIFKGLLSEGDFTVLVDLKGPEEAPEYYIFPTTVLDEKLRKYFDSWLARPGLGGKPHSPDNRMYRLGAKDQPGVWVRLASHRNGWYLILDYLAR